MATPAQLSNVANPYRPLTELEQRTIIPPTDPWTNSYAITIVRDSVDYMERYLQQAGHLNRWVQADEMLVGWRPLKLWENSKKQRARIPVFLLFSQLQSLLPNVLQAIFPLHENLDVAPRPGSTMQDANEAFDLIMAQLDSLGEEGITRFYSIATEAFTQGFLYGNGVVEITWLYKLLSRLACTVEWRPEMRQIFDELTGQMLNVPVGPPLRRVMEHIQQITINQPNIQAIDCRDFLIDPNCRSHRVQDARMCAVRSYPTVGELIGYRGQPYFDIPPDATLIELAKQKYQSPLEPYKRQSAAAAGRQWNPMDEYTNDPYQMRVELYRWFSRDRCVWMLNRQWAAYNRTNIYGILPFLNAFYVPFPNRWHGISLSDVTEGSQNLIASLKESRMDELSLAINAPFVRQSGSMIGQPGSIAMSPSKVIDVNGKPEDTLKRLDIQMATQAAFLESNDAERSAAKDTGLSDMAIMGATTPGGDSSQRTARGIEAKVSASSIRIQFLVENIEHSLLEPLCSIMHQFNLRFIPREQLMPILGVDGQQKVIDPVRILNAMPRFTMRAGARMKSRSMLMQVLPWFIQTMLNPELQQAMAKYNKKILRPDNLMYLVTDTLQLPRLELWRDMSPEEEQAFNQPDPKLIFDMQKQRERMQAQAELQQDKGDTELMNTVMGKVITPRSAEDFMGFEDHQLMNAEASKQKAAQRPRANNGGSR